MGRTMAANMGSSPPSSTEATRFGTPSTNITAMSPEACSSAFRHQLPPYQQLRVNTNVARNAFRNPPHHLNLPAMNAAYLSPTAQEFTPRTATFDHNTPHSSSQRISPVHNLVAGSMPDVRANQQPMPYGTIGGAGSMIIRSVKSQTPLSPDVVVVWGQFSDDENVTRTFQIFDHNIPCLHHILNQFPTRFTTLACVDNKHIESGIIRLTFHDDRDAKQAYVLVASMTHPYSHLNQLTPKDVAVAHGQNPNTVSNFEGQILLTILYNAHSTMPTVAQLFEKLSTYGEIKAMATAPSNIMSSIMFKVEYHHVMQAEEAVKNLDQTSFQGTNYLAAHYQPDVDRRFPPASDATNTNINHFGQPSFTGRSTVPSGDLARLENVMARVMRESSGSGRGPMRGGHNVVDIHRIQTGVDVRTTIMLRNIPNRVDQAGLKKLLDVTSFGDYDFMYLRIDFANNCNVGYAFINFVDPLAIIPFARARAGQRWNIFSSDKVAEISYATIQGRDCLIQKFRNSSVMLEHPSYRPKLYTTRPSLYAGQEEDFPEPDNYSKMRRSIDNAEHIGLFAPREGQAHREEQRRRRSQFDRGTPGAEIELSSYRLTDAGLQGPHIDHLLSTFDSLGL